MKSRQGFMFAYRLLLRLYPSSFRARFAPEMLELAQAADRAEWPLIFGDTTIAIVRCWFEGTRSAALVAESNAYLSLGESSVKPSRILQGMVLFLAIAAGAVMSITAGLRHARTAFSLNPTLQLTFPVADTDAPLQSPRAFPRSRCRRRARLCRISIHGANRPMVRQSVFRAAARLKADCVDI